MPPPFSTSQRALFIFSISLVTLLIVLDYSIANIAIPYIAGGLAVSIDQGVYVITFFSIGNAIGLAVTGWLIRRVGQVRLLLVSVALFTFFSWICGLSPSILMLVCSRFIQGLVSGPLLPLSQSMLIKEGKPEHRTRDLSIWSTIVITGPVLGPLLGGYISYWYDWSWIFYINIPIGIACFVTLFWLLAKRETKTERVPSDVAGIILLCIAVTCFQIFLDKGQQWDWFNSYAIRAAFITCIIATIFFILRELGTRFPFFEVRLMKIFSFSFALVLLFLSYGIYFGSIVIVPLWLQQYMGYDAMRAGIAVAPLGVGPVLLSLIAPKLIQKTGNVLALIICFVTFCASAFYTSNFLTAVDSYHIGFSRFFMGLGFVCYITPLIQISIQDALPREMPSVVGIFHFFRALSGAVGASVFETIWQRRTIFHHERIGSALTEFNPFTPEMNDLRSLGILNYGLDKEASMMAFNDVFYLMGWLYVGSIVFMLVYYCWAKSKKIAQPKQEIVHLSE